MNALQDADETHERTDEAGTDVEAAVRFDRVGKQFHDEWVLRDLDLTIRPGSVFGMIGPSGCGKTTTVRLALGYFSPDAGTVRLFGRDPVSRTAAERKSVGYLPQHPVLFDELTLWQNLNYHASLNGVAFRRSARLERLLELVGLSEHRSKSVSESSGGMRRRLALAATMVHDPPLLMLDEPTAGIDPILRQELWDEFRSLRELGHTLVVTTQFVEEAAYCDEVAILADGELVDVGAPDELVQRAHGGRRFDVQFDRAVTGRMLDALAGSEMISDATAHSERVARVTLRPGVAPPDDEAVGLQEAIRERLSAHIEQAEVASVSAVPTDWNDVFARIVGGRAPETVAVDDASSEDAHG